MDVKKIIEESFEETVGSVNRKVLREEIVMAYVAGILDGDGSFSIMKSNGKYYPCIQLSNAFKGMSEWLHELFGGSLRVKKPQKEHYKPLYVWSLRGLQGCKNLLEKMEPDLLVLKNWQAASMLCFIEDKMKKVIPEGELSKYSLEMQNLNLDILLSHGLVRQSDKENGNELFWSYLAGIMDTEGSFSIKKEKPHSGSVSPRYNPMIQLTMVPVEVFNHIRRFSSFGRFCVIKSKSSRKGFAHKMSICGKDECMRFCHKLIPYLRFKKGQLFTLLNFCENYGAVKHCQGKIPKETLEFREEMYQQMRKLNA